MSEENKSAIIICVGFLTFVGMITGAMLWVDGAPYRFALKVQENTLACYDKVETSEAKALCGTMPTPIIPKDR